MGLGIAERRLPLQLEGTALAEIKNHVATLKSVEINQVIQDVYSVSNLKLKSGLQGTVVSIDKGAAWSLQGCYGVLDVGVAQVKWQSLPDCLRGGDARIDFNIETFAGGLNATQWVYKKAACSTTLALELKSIESSLEGLRQAECG